MSNILQSDIWARFQESNGHTVIRKSGNGWSYLATVEGGATGRYLYSPYGPVASSAVAFDEALASLKEEAAKLRCLFVRIEPTESAIWGDQDAAAFLARRGAVLAPRQVQPSHTQIIDLSGTEDEIIKGMISGYRTRHRNIHKKGVTVEASTNPSDMSILFGFLEETAERNGFNRQHDDYLMQAARVLMPAGAASLYIAKLAGENGESTPIAAAFVYDSDDTRTYALRHRAGGSAGSRVGRFHEVQEVLRRRVRGVPGYLGCAGHLAGLPRLHPGVQGSSCGLRCSGKGEGKGSVLPLSLTTSGAPIWVGSES